jgi:cation diffusion facilitator family transporter
MVQYRCNPQDRRKHLLKRTREQIAMRASWHTLVINVFLAVLKLFVGIFARSSALIADAANSVSDVLATIVVMVGFKMAGKTSDKEHPYGHERLESAAAIILAAFVVGTGLLIGYRGVTKIIEGVAGELDVPGGLALIAAIITMVLKEGMYWYTRAAAKEADSGALMAVAWDHRSDVLASAGSFIGVLGARIGLPILDPIAGVAICILILRVGINIFRDALKKMTDTSCDEEFEEELRAIALAQDGVLGVDSISTRLFGDRIYVDIEISADGALTLDEAHDAAERVHDAIEMQYEKVKHCMVHVNPAE